MLNFREKSKQARFQILYSAKSQTDVPPPLSDNKNINANLPVATVYRDDITATIKSLAPSAKEWFTIVYKTTKTNADLKVAIMEKPKEEFRNGKVDSISGVNPVPVNTYDDKDDYVQADAEKDENEEEEHFDRLVKWVMANFDNYSQFLNLPLDPSEPISPTLRAISTTYPQLTQPKQTFATILLKIASIDSAKEKERENWDEIAFAIALGRITLIMQIGRNDAEKVKSERMTDEKVAAVKVVSVMKESMNLEDMSPTKDVANLMKKSSDLVIVISATVTVENFTEPSSRLKKYNKKKKSKVSSSFTQGTPVVSDEETKKSLITKMQWELCQNQSDEFWENDEDDAIPVEYKSNSPRLKQPLSPLKKTVKEISNSVVLALPSIHNNAVIPEVPATTLVPLPTGTSIFAAKWLSYWSRISKFAPSVLALFESNGSRANKTDNEEIKSPELKSEIKESPLSGRKTGTSTFVEAKPGIGSKSIVAIGNERKMARPSVLNNSPRIAGGSSFDGKDL
ncbi:hypothetical protein HK100_001976 [Physocladia obscura]|uniref:Uncharacterized protein n=1 Tax=Physocladia obscura TaxID=109957 RepID=A0AAD5SXN9_9FUNG|nr:hypothetical protein HK100_001976 [Physocladia obscura]